MHTPAVQFSFVNIFCLERSKAQCTPRQYTPGSTPQSPQAFSFVQARAAKMHEARALHDYEEMRECTFTPEVNKADPAAMLQKVGGLTLNP